MIYINHDAMFNKDTIDSDGIQLLLEKMESWLATEIIDGQKFSEWIVKLSQRHGYNPLFWLAFMQKEQSLTEKHDRPDQKSLDWCLGYGCPEGGGRKEIYRGFKNQFYCQYKDRSGRMREGGAMPQFKNYADWWDIKNWKTAQIRLYDPPSVRARYGIRTPTILAESYEDALNFLYNPRIEGVAGLSEIYKKYYALAEKLGAIKKRKDG